MNWPILTVILVASSLLYDALFYKIQLRSSRASQEFAKLQPVEVFSLSLFSVLLYLSAWSCGICALVVRFAL